MKIKEILEKTAADNELTEKLVFCDKNVLADKIKVIMINETAPEETKDYFYSDAKDAGYMKTSKMLFAKAGIDVNKSDDLLQMGIYPHC